MVERLRQSATRTGNIAKVQKDSAEEWSAYLRYPRAAAFEAGRAWNRTRYYAVLVQFAPATRRYQRRVRKSATRFLRLGRCLLQDHDSREEFSVQVGAAVCDLLDHLGQEGFHEVIDNVIECLKNPQDYGGAHISAEDYGEYRRDCLRLHVREIIAVMDELRTLLFTLGTEEFRVYFQLGTLIDEGLRRDDIEEHVYKICDRTVLQHGRFINRALVSFTRPHSGSTAPKQEWKQAVQQLLIELRIHRRVPASLFSELPTETRESRVKTVRQLAEAVNQALRSRTASRLSTRSPKQSRNDPRDAWMAEMRAKGRSLKYIRLELKKIHKERGWGPIDSDQGIAAALKRYESRKE